MPVKRLFSSQHKGVCWDQRFGKWRVEVYPGPNQGGNQKPRRTFLGHFATEEAAAQAYNQHVEDGFPPIQRRVCSSQFKGVTWEKASGAWKAVCLGKGLGYHAAEEDAARAYNMEAERIGRVDFNIVPPACGAAHNGGGRGGVRLTPAAARKAASAAARGRGSNTAAAAADDEDDPDDLPLAATPAGQAYAAGAAALARLRPPAGQARAHSGSKRAAMTTTAARQKKKQRLDSLAAAAAGAGARAAGARGGGARAAGAGPAGARGAGAMAAAAAVALDTLAGAAAGAGGTAAATVTVTAAQGYEPVMAALKRYNLAHLAARFRENNVDAVAFRGITEAMLEAMVERCRLTLSNPRLKRLEPSA